MVFNEVKLLKEKFNNSVDVAVKEFICGNKNINIVYIKSMIDENIFLSGILSPLIDFGSRQSQISKGKDFTIDKISKEVLKAIDLKKISKNECLEELSSNKALLFLEDEKEVLSIDIVKYPVRLPAEPPTSAVIKGPREGFVEDLKTNISLLRRRFSGEKIVIDQIKIGKYSQTKIIITYINGIANKKIIKQVKEKLKSINIDGIIDSYYLISFLQNKESSIFKQVGSSEKPDVIASKMLEGRVAILVDNTPIVLTVPFIYLEDLQNSNDYYSLSNYAAYIRIIRLLGLGFAVLVPGIYISLRLYHYNIVPINFLITIANATVSIPLTPFLEIFFILILFEILYEVSLRLPRYLGLATSVVGALILGDTGVKAGLISPPGVMVIAISIIAVYTIPDQVDQINLLRAVFIILGASLGLFGIIAGVVFVIAYLNSLDNFGVAYLSPYSPRISQDLKDGVLKRNILSMKTRPKSLQNQNKVRLRNGKNN